VIAARAAEKEKHRKTTLQKSAKSNLPPIDTRAELAAIAGVSADLRGKLYNGRKKARGGTGSNQHEQKDQNDPSANISEIVAKETGVSDPSAHLSTAGPPDLTTATGPTSS
jgi:hypothetical protein